MNKFESGQVWITKSERPVLIEEVTLPDYREPYRIHGKYLDDESRSCWTCDGKNQPWYPSKEDLTTRIV